MGISALSKVLQGSPPKGRHTGYCPFQGAPDGFHTKRQKQGWSYSLGVAIPSGMTPSSTEFEPERSQNHFFSGPKVLTIDQEWPRQDQRQRNFQFMNLFEQAAYPDAQKFDDGGYRACFPKEKHQNSKNEAISFLRYSKGLVCRGDSWKLPGRKHDSGKTPRICALTSVKGTNSPRWYGWDPSPNPMIFAEIHMNFCRFWPFLWKRSIWKPGQIFAELPQISAGHRRNRHQPVSEPLIVSSGPM